MNYKNVESLQPIINVINEANRQRRIDLHSSLFHRQEHGGNSGMTEQHLYERIDKASQKSPACTVQIGDKNDGQHACDGDATAKGKVEGRDGDERADK